LKGRGKGPLRTDPPREKKRLKKGKTLLWNKRKEKSQKEPLKVTDALRRKIEQVSEGDRFVKGGRPVRPALTRKKRQD